MAKRGEKKKILLKATKMSRSWSEMRNMLKERFDVSALINEREFKMVMKRICYIVVKTGRKKSRQQSRRRATRRNEKQKRGGGRLFYFYIREMPFQLISKLLSNNERKPQAIIGYDHITWWRRSLLNNSYRGRTHESCCDFGFVFFFLLNLRSQGKAVTIFHPMYV